MVWQQNLIRSGQSTLLRLRPSPTTNLPAHPLQAAGVFGDIIVLTGGCVGAQTCSSDTGFCSCTAITDDVTAFDTKTQSYSLLPTMPIPR